MSTNSSETEKKYIAAWKKAGTLLEDVRARELPLVDTVKGLQSLLPAFAACVKERKVSATSGLIEQQKIFSRYWNR